MKKLTDEYIEEQVTEFFEECLEEGLDIDIVEQTICESVDTELINQISNVGDNSALNYIQEFFNNNGFQLLPINSILKNCFFSKGFFNE